MSERSEGADATLALRGACFRIAGAAPSTPVTLSAHARSIGLIGEWSALFRALTGEAEIEGEGAWLCGFPLRSAIADGIAGVAPCDPPLPSSFSVREYLEHAARLVHGAHAHVEQDVTRALDDFGLRARAKQKIIELPLADRRALVIAVAAFGEPRVCLLEAPLRGLETAAADRIARSCEQLAARTRLVLSSEAPITPSPARALLDRCEEIFWFERGELVAQGTPKAVFSGTLRYRFAFTGNAQRDLAGALNEAGCELEPREESAIAAVLFNGVAATRYFIDLPNGVSPTLVLDAARDAGVTVLELSPLTRA